MYGQVQSEGRAYYVYQQYWINQSSIVWESIMWESGKTRKPLCKLHLRSKSFCKSFPLYKLVVVVINPRRTCAARVTVLGLCVCLCVVCLHLFSSYKDQAGSSAIPTALAQQGLEKLCGDFA